MDRKCKADLLVEQIKRYVATRLIVRVEKLAYAKAQMPNRSTRECTYKTRLQTYAANSTKTRTTFTMRI